MISETKSLSTIKEQLDTLPAWEGMSPDTRIWIYASNRPFTPEEEEQVTPHLEAFARQWASHNVQLHAWGGILFNKFIVLAVDESRQDASGCSIDTSVRYLRSLESALGIDLFDRWNFHFMEDDAVKTLPKEEFVAAFRSGRIQDDTLVFDHLVNTLGKLKESWIKPLGQSWHRRFV